MFFTASLSFPNVFERGRTMTHDEIKAFIAARTREGHNLSKIQDMLAEQGVKMTFMELRLIASEIETSFWQKAEPQPEPAPEPESPRRKPRPPTMRTGSRRTTPTRNSFPRMNPRPRAKLRLRTAKRNRADAPRSRSTSSPGPDSWRPAACRSAPARAGTGASTRWAA